MNKATMAVWRATSIIVCATQLKTLRDKKIFKKEKKTEEKYYIYWKILLFDILFMDGRHCCDLNDGHLKYTAYVNVLFMCDTLWFWSIDLYVTFCLFFISLRCFPFSMQKSISILWETCSIVVQHTNDHRRQSNKKKKRSETKYKNKIVSNYKINH